MVAYYTGSDPIEIDNLWLKVKVTMMQFPFFLRDSVNFPTVDFSYLSTIKVKHGKLLIKYALCRFTFECHEK